MSASLVITVDTEPDDQWEPPGPDGLLPAFRFANTRGLGRLKEFLHGLRVPVTWMTSYSVARDRESARVLRQAASEGDEIGGHLHGWEAPPFTDIDRTSRPFIYEYDPDLRLAKHRSLRAALQDAFEQAPVSYRSGRWGTDALEIEHLAGQGYRIDSSVAPGIDFRDRAGFRQLGPDFRGYLTAPPLGPHRVGSLWEVPVSIVPVGWLGAGRLAVRTARAVAMHHRPARWRRWSEGGLASGGLLRVVWVRPLKHPRTDLVRAARSLVRCGAAIINVMFHSSEAFVGTSPLSRSAADVERLYGDLEAIVAAVTATGQVVPRTLRAAVAALGGDPG